MAEHAERLQHRLMRARPARAELQSWTRPGPVVGSKRSEVLGVRAWWLTPTRACASLAECGKGRAGPAERMVRWAVDAVGGARVLSIRALHGDQGPWRLSVDIRGRREGVVLRSVTPRIDAPMIATGAAALEVAERHGLAAPRLLAKDLDGQAAGAPATLETFIDGSTAWPSVASITQFHVAGAALAKIHAVELDPLPHLPFRPRPIAVDDFARDRREGRMATSPLLRTADEWIQSVSHPQGRTVLVHGDVWPGNVAWTNDTACTLIDWKTAGVGDPGVDIGELRKQVAIAYGLEETKRVVDGWERACGLSVTDVAYWDAVAALNTRTDIGSVESPRRDAFLRAALEQLAG